MLSISSHAHYSELWNTPFGCTVKICSLFGIAFITETVKQFEIWSQNLNLNEKKKTNENVERGAENIYLNVKWNAVGQKAYVNSNRPWNLLIDSLLATLKMVKRRIGISSVWRLCQRAAFNRHQHQHQFRCEPNIFLIGSTLSNWIYANWRNICVCIISQSPPLKYRMEICIVSHISWGHSVFMNSIW